MIVRSYYNAGHWKGCMCSGCGAVYMAHNPSAPNIISCSCPGCQSRYEEMMYSKAKATLADQFGSEQPTMASINICERQDCESMIKGRAVGAITLVLNNDDRIPPQDRIIKLEICPGCVADLYAVLNHGPISNRQRAYGEPFRPESNDLADVAVQQATTEQLAALLLERIMKDPEARKQIGSGIPTQREGD